MSHDLRPSEFSGHNVTEAVFDIEDVGIFEWCPRPNGEGKPTQVWLRVKCYGSPSAFVWHFKGPDTLGQVIAALQRHRKSVWPDAPEWKP